MTAETILPPQRSREHLAREYAASLHYLDAIRALVADYMALDIRPLLIHPDGTVERLGEYSIPDDLREALVTAMTSKMRLEYEMASLHGYGIG